jgi:hypothetical protein
MSLLLGCSQPSPPRRLSPSIPAVPATRPSRSYTFPASLTEGDLQAIEALIRDLTHDPIMQIEADELDNIEVMTGVIRGPLDGGGTYFNFAKRNGHWTQIHTGSQKFWVS